MLRSQALASLLYTSNRSNIVLPYRKGVLGSLYVHLVEIFLATIRMEAFVNKRGHKIAVIQGRCNRGLVFPDRTTELRSALGRVQHEPAMHGNAEPLD